ncbi:hypothetical protein G9409_07500 [Chlorobium sp. BLA1]|uniref:iron chaperone n=1 Tax=Candidatus Chlorobium masyuteum TaxID=2716876 RepID=UPI00142464E8|nr:DUF1801 domain-containing protein [Candidatus Chlorobium masyuteum]NHQ60434.1 hypothetical protein [Candidatus Chlorobium masyuteum]
MKQESPKSIDEYIAGFPMEIRQTLEQIRATVRAAAPDADEKISYQMPTFTLHGNLVHFAAFKTHIGFYPAPSAVEHFRKELAVYDCAKGTIRFPHGKPVPLDLISRIVQFRVKENLAKAVAKGRIVQKSPRS